MGKGALFEFGLMVLTTLAYCLIVISRRKRQGNVKYEALREYLSREHPPVERNIPIQASVQYDFPKQNCENSASPGIPSDLELRPVTAKAGTHLSERIFYL